MGTHNICHYKEVDRKYTGCNLKTTGLLDCALIEVCAVIRSNTVIRKILILHILKTTVSLQSSDNTAKGNTRNVQG